MEISNDKMRQKKMPLSRYEMGCYESSEDSSLAHPRCQDRDRFFLNNFIYLSLSFWLCWVFVAAHAFV